MKPSLAPSITLNVVPAVLAWHHPRHYLLGRTVSVLCTQCPQEASIGSFGHVECGPSCPRLLVGLLRWRSPRTIHHGPVGQAKCMAKTVNRLVATNKTICAAAARSLFRIKPSTSHLRLVRPRRWIRMRLYPVFKGLNRVLETTEFVPSETTNSIIAHNAHVGAHVSINCYGRPSSRRFLVIQ